MMSSRDRLPAITVAELAAARADGADPVPILLDVRNPDEFARVRIEGAVLMPMPHITRRFRELPAGRPIHVICQSGSRSAAVTQFLVANGYPEAANVAGGMVAWLRSGYPAISGRPSTGEGDLDP